MDLEEQMRLDAQWVINGSLWKVIKISEKLNLVKFENVYDQETMVCSLSDFKGGSND